MNTRRGFGHVGELKVLLDCAVAVVLVAFALLALRGVLGRDDFLEGSRMICHVKTASIPH